MASPFADVVNATITFHLPTTGTTTDPLGNVIPNTEEIEATAFLKSTQEFGDISPGVDNSLAVLSGFAVEPMNLDTRIGFNTTGTVTWKGRTLRCVVTSRNAIYGDDGLIAETLTAERGDDITLTVYQQG